MVAVISSPFLHSAAIDVLVISMLLLDIATFTVVELSFAIGSQNHSAAVWPALYSRSVPMKTAHLFERLVP
jgi:hypothetical protein